MAQRSGRKAAGQGRAEAMVAEMARNQVGVFAAREQMTGAEISSRMTDVHKLRCAVASGDRAEARRAAEAMLASLR